MARHGLIGEVTMTISGLALGARLVMAAVLCAGLALTGCAGSRSSFEPAPGRALQQADSGIDADSVAVRRADGAGVAGDVPAGAQLVGRVVASADARFRAGIDGAERLAERRLRRAAADAGANLVIVRTMEVVEIDAGAIELATPTFEDDRRDRLSPGGAGYAPTKRVFRVTLAGDAVTGATSGRIVDE